MNIFGKNRENWEFRGIDERVKKHIQKLGFQIFSYDKGYLVDSQGNQYGAWAGLLDTEKIVREQGGTRNFEVVRGVREIKPEEDMFQFVQELNSCWLGSHQEWEEMHFVGRSPSKTHYNASIIAPVATWREDGQDGGGQKTLYSLLMLQARVERRECFYRDETPEEKRIREIESSFPLW